MLGRATPPGHMLGRTNPPCHVLGRTTPVLTMQSLLWSSDYAEMSDFSNLVQVKLKFKNKFKKKDPN